MRKSVALPADLDIRDHVPLAPRTTLGLGGPARHHLVAKTETDVVAALDWARRRDVRVAILGGGSNLVVSDSGFDGLVVEMALSGVEERIKGTRVFVTAAAGEAWDPFVARTVAARYAGLECLSGIPGRVGASPIQNVGAYGQEVAERLHEVRVFDRDAQVIRTLSPSQCEFAYRDSLFKRHPNRFVVFGATFVLEVDGAPSIRYAELERALGNDRGLATVRDEVIRLRRKKSMVIDAADPNRRSAGSFFTNPIVSRGVANALVERAMADGVVASAAAVPRWPHGNDVKLAAGWLIERAGIAKGLRRGNVGVSTHHALALVHHGGGSTRELMSLADEIRRTVSDRFGVTLVPEPVFLE